MKKRPFLPMDLIQEGQKVVRVTREQIQIWKIEHLPMPPSYLHCRTSNHQHVVDNGKIALVGLAELLRFERRPAATGAAREIVKAASPHCDTRLLTPSKTSMSIITAGLLYPSSSQRSLSEETTSNVTSDFVCFLLVCFDDGGGDDVWDSEFFSGQI